MTGCERIVARLERGPATAAELYATTFSVVHSRISDLRRQGDRIECDTLPDGEGAARYVYRLLSSPSSLPAEPAPKAIPSGTGAEAQLTLEVAA